MQKNTITVINQQTGPECAIKSLGVSYAGNHTDPPSAKELVARRVDADINVAVKKFFALLNK